MEEIYWTHFQTVGFAVLLSGDFRAQLMIPKKFSESVRKKLPEKVAIRGPGAYSDDWEVQLSTSNNTTCFVGDGWKEFVDAYSLKENDILIFKYKKNSYFKVSMFDSQSSWVENESSYFVKKSIAKKVDCEEKQKESSPQTFGENGNQGRTVTRGEETDKISKKRDSRVRASMLVVEDSEDEIELPTKGKSKDPEWRPRKISRDEVSEIRTPPRNTCDEIRFVPESPRRETDTKLRAVLPGGLRGRRGVECTCVENLSIPEEKIERAKQRAHVECSGNSFFTVMSCTLVHRLFRLNLPKHWIKKFMPGCNQNVIVRLSGQEDKEWCLRYNYDKNRSSGIFISGWKHFVLDNGLSLFDVCVFTPVDRKNGILRLDVKIIRVLEDHEGDEHNDGELNQNGNGNGNGNGNVVVGLASKKLYHLSC